MSTLPPPPDSNPDSTPAPPAPPSYGSQPLAGLPGMGSEKLSSPPQPTSPIQESFTPVPAGSLPAGSQDYPAAPPAPPTYPPAPMVNQAAQPPVYGYDSYGNPVYSPPPQAYPPQPDYNQQYGQVPPPGQLYGQGGMPQYNQGYPQAPMPPVAVSDSTFYSKVALGLSLAGLILCCCWPVALGLGIAGTALGKSQLNLAKQQGYNDPIAVLAFWFGIAAIVVSLLMFLQGIIQFMLNPNAYDEIMQDLMNL